MHLATLAERGKKDKKSVARLGKVLLIKVLLHPLDKYACFQPAKRHSIFSTMPSQIDLALKEAPNRRPGYFLGKDETLQPKMHARPSTLLTLHYQQGPILT
jgi:hypothetical protein